MNSRNWHDDRVKNDFDIGTGVGNPSVPTPPPSYPDIRLSVIVASSNYKRSYSQIS
jgi:16S rRNA G527 N7-methylase RsmG